MPKSSLTLGFFRLERSGAFLELIEEPFDIVVTVVFIEFKLPLALPAYGRPEACVIAIALSVRREIKLISD